MAPDLLVQQEIKKFSVTDEAIAQMRADYMSLSVGGLKDKEGYLAVQDALKDVKGTRVQVEHTRKELNEVPLKWQRTVNTEAKRITEQLQQIEDHLKNQKKGIDDTKARIKREQEEAAEKAHQARIQELFSLKFSFNGEVYVCGEISIQPLQIKALDEHNWSVFMDRAKEESAQIIAKEEAEAKRKAEEERILREQKIEQDAKAKELEEREAKLKEEEKTAAREKEAAKREKEAKEKAERQARAQEIIDKQTAERKARAEALKPEKERLRTWIDDQFSEVEQIDINSEEALHFFNKAGDAFDAFKSDLFKILNSIYDGQS
jgi:chromosome segregation ATPase